MVDVSPLTSYIECRFIDGAKAEYLFNGSAANQNLILNQTNTDWRTTIDTYNMVANKGVKASLSYSYNGSSSVSPIPTTPYQFTGFIAPLSRRYRVKLLAYSPSTSQVKVASTYNFGTGDILRLVADIQPFIIVSKYGTDSDYYYSSPQDFSTLEYRKGLIFTSATGSVSTNFVIPKLNSLTAAYEVEINLDAGDFVGFCVAIVPQLSSFKVTTDVYSGSTRSTLFMRASIIQIED